MKLLLKQIVLLFAASNLSVGGEQELADWQRFSSALQEWRAVAETISTDQPPDQDLVEKKAQGIFEVWEALPDRLRKDYAGELSLVRFGQAELAVSAGDWENALRFLRMEADFQHEMGRSLSRQTKSPERFFERLVEIQCQVLGHVGHSESLGKVDYQLISVDGARLFAVARTTQMTDEFGVEIPPLDEGEQRTKILLLAQIPDGRYVISSRDQVIGRIDDPPLLKVSDGDSSILVLSPVIKDVTLVDGIPRRYEPRADPVKQYRIGGEQRNQLRSE